MTQEKQIKWNGEFGEKCNLPIDCIVCDIEECTGRESELGKPVSIRLKEFRAFLQTKANISQLNHSRWVTPLVATLREFDKQFPEIVPVESVQKDGGSK